MYSIILSIFDLGLILPLSSRPRTSSLSDFLHRLIQRFFQIVEWFPLADSYLVWSVYMLRTKLGFDWSRNSDSIVKKTRRKWDLNSVRINLKFINIPISSPTVFVMIRWSMLRAPFSVVIRTIRYDHFEYFSHVDNQFTDALTFWKEYWLKLPLLSHMDRCYLSTPTTSLPSESAFSISAFYGRKERAHLSPENLALSVYLKDKLNSSS